MPGSVEDQSGHLVDLEWQALGLCREVDPEAFFPEQGESARDAKRVCGLCEVRAECLEYALAHDERFGIWGGLTERERRLVRKDRAAADPETATSLSGGAAA